MTPKIAPTIVPGERSLRFNAGAPFQTTIIYSLATLRLENTVKMPVVNAK
jgi:hypothetical protein